MLKGLQDTSPRKVSRRACDVTSQAYIWHSSRLSLPASKVCQYATKHPCPSNLVNYCLSNIVEPQRSRMSSALWPSNSTTLGFYPNTCEYLAHAVLFIDDWMIIVRMMMMMINEVYLFSQ